MISHPKRTIYGPERLRDPRNFVAMLFTVYGPAPWDFASEVGPQMACGRCGGKIGHHGIACGGCHRVARENQRKFDRERSQVWDPKPDAKPKMKAKFSPTVAGRLRAKIAARREKKTERDRRRFMQAARPHLADPAVAAWVAEHGLVA